MTSDWQSTKRRDKEKSTPSRNMVNFNIKTKEKILKASRKNRSHAIDNWNMKRTKHDQTEKKKQTSINTWRDVQQHWRTINCKARPNGIPIAAIPLTKKLNAKCWRDGPEIDAAGANWYGHYISQQGIMLQN